VVKDKKEVFKFIVEEKILIQKLSQVQVKGGAASFITNLSYVANIFPTENISSLDEMHSPFVCVFVQWMV